MTSPANIADAHAPSIPQQIALAGELASYARAARDPLAMIEAARVLVALPRHVFAPGATTPAALYAEARLLAAGDRTMLQEIDAVQYGYTRPIAGCYVADSWIVQHQGNGTNLSATPRPNIRLGIGEPVWTAPTTAKVA